MQDANNRALKRKPTTVHPRKQSQGLLEISSWVSATEEEFTLTRFSTSLGSETEKDMRGEGRDKRGGEGRKGMSRNERRRRRDEEFIHVETGSSSRALTVHTQSYTH